MIDTFPIFLRIDKGTWSRVSETTFPRRSLTILAAFTLSAWNRFGSQAFLGPRAPLRFILTGIYGWLALSLLIWFVGSRFDGDLIDDWWRTLQRTAASVSVAHFPLIILGFYIATFGNFIRNPWPGTVLAVLVFTVWIPVLLARALQHIVPIELGRERGKAVAAVVGPYLLWLLWIGRFLWQQVGHLL